MNRPPLKNPSISDFVRLKTERIFFLVMGFFCLVILSGSVFLSLRELDNYVNFLGRNLGQALVDHVINGEVMPLAQKLNEFEAQKWCKRIVVTDRKHRVIHSRMSSGLPTAQYRKTVSATDYEHQFPILSNGILHGYILLDKNYSSIIPSILFAIGVVILVGLVFYSLISRGLFPGVFRRVHSEMGEMARVLENLSGELNTMDVSEGSENERFLEKGHQAIQALPSHFSEVDQLKSHAENVLTAMQKIREHIVEKTRLKALYQESRHKVNQLNEEIRKEVEKQSLVASISAQVAHDIRSPLTALKMFAAADDLNEEAHRSLLRSSIRRVEEIASDLSLKSKNNPGLDGVADEIGDTSGNAKIEPAYALIWRGVSEACLQHPDRSRVEIFFEPSVDAFRYGIHVNKSRFSRTLSNLINNAVESIKSKGRVRIGLEKNQDQIQISVIDNGSGIPEHVRAALGKEIITHGKIDGSGLGFHYAYESIAIWGGTIDVQSSQPGGTSVILTLPAHPLPTWFRGELKFKKEGLIAIVDDDLSVHEMWDTRFETAIPKRVPVKHFANSTEIKQWIHSPEGIANLERTHFLMDFSLRNDYVDGIELIRSLRLEQKSTLVTSYFDEQEIIELCKMTGIPLLAKDLIAEVPIRVI